MEYNDENLILDFFGALNGETLKNCLEDKKRIEEQLNKIKEFLEL